MPGWRPRASPCSMDMAGGAGLWKIWRISGPWGPGAQSRPKSRPSSPPRSRPDLTRAAVEGARAAPHRLPLARRLRGQRHVYAEQPVHLVAGRLLGCRHLAPLSLVEAWRNRGLELAEERAHALRELGAVAGAFGAGRGQAEGAASLDEGAEADEIDRLLESLAQLRLDAVVQRGRLIRVASEGGAAKRGS